MKYILLILLTITCYTAHADQIYQYTNVDIKWNADTGGGYVSQFSNPVIRINTTDQGYAVLITNPATPTIEVQEAEQPSWYEGWAERHPDQKENKHKHSHVVTRFKI